MQPQVQQGGINTHFCGIEWLVSGGITAPHVCDPATRYLFVSVSLRHPDPDLWKPRVLMCLCPSQSMHQLLSVMAACCHCKHWTIGYTQRTSVDISLHHRNMPEKRSICFSCFRLSLFNRKVALFKWNKQRIWFVCEDEMHNIPYFDSTFRVAAEVACLVLVLNSVSVVCSNVFSSLHYRSRLLLGYAC